MVSQEHSSLGQALGTAMAPLAIYGGGGSHSSLSLSHIMMVGSTGWSHTCKCLGMRLKSHVLAG